MPVQIAKPTLTQVGAIKALLDFFALQNAVLPRSVLDICEKIQMFWVAVRDDVVVGCVGLQFYPDYFAEIQSLAVDSSCQGQGIGSSLVNKCIIDAKKYGAKRLFALTNIPRYFEQFEFKKIEKSSLPQKIWKETINFELRQNPEHSAIDLILE